MNPSKAGPAVLAAVNHMQQTRWRINRHVYTTLLNLVEAGSDFPGMPSPHDLPVPDRLPDDVWASMTKEDQDQVRIAREVTHSENIHRDEQRRFFGRRMATLAKAAQHDSLWCAYFLDFRGRAYTRSEILSPQGDGLSKGLLEFAEGKLAGERGKYWLRIAFANAMGHDKRSLADRVLWVTENAPLVEAMALDPLDCLSEWGASSVDSPWEALAAAKALYDAEQGRPVHLPVRVDATCSGLQHLSAMLRDEVAGRSVNLMDTGNREDIYGEVRDLVSAQVALDAAAGNPLAMHWLQRVTRAVVKPAVMNLPYGISDDTVLRAHLYPVDLVSGHVPSKGGERWKACKYLRDVIVQKANERIGRPKLMLGWFKQVARAVAEATKDERGLLFRSPSGFMVAHEPEYSRCVSVETLSYRGTIQAPEHDAGVAREKLLSGAAPNVIHSYDAGHLALTVLGMRDAGVCDLALVHDSFGTHAADMDTLARVAREQWLAIYGQDQLARFLASVRDHTGVERLPEPPALGGLDPGQVLGSPYFLS
jgi:DNA-directed RNA polymerase